ncbi:hypothetical protein RhiirA4_481576 [Rhizophagus irregularis]|uniref:Uncharacterized protein n=1 Tax=Rhizophagus irregularis TaxID=588596 RepID=A0A2I1HJR1_9GLOM|nr:hypothetical protein RhiirA4_481576 [Rhizophagus irregularis]
MTFKMIFDALSKLAEQAKKKFFYLWKAKAPDFMMHIYIFIYVLVGDLSPQRDF